MAGKGFTGRFRLAWRLPAFLMVMRKGGLCRMFAMFLSMYLEEKAV